MGPLARRSYALHAQLAEELGTDCGYRRMTTHSLSVRAGAAGATARGGGGARQLPGLPAWVDRGALLQSSVIGGPDTTAQVGGGLGRRPLIMPNVDSFWKHCKPCTRAGLDSSTLPCPCPPHPSPHFAPRCQVHPELLTKALLQRMQEAGGSLQLAAVAGVEAEGPRVTSVRVRDAASGQERLLRPDAVVFALGAWSAALRAWLPQLPEVSSLKVHSIVLADPERRATADALFLAYRGSDGKSLEPEVYREWQAGPGAAHRPGVAAPAASPPPPPSTCIDPAGPPSGCSPPQRPGLHLRLQ